MPLLASYFTPPYGPLRSSLFPGDDLPAFLAAWMDEAEAKAAAAGLATDSDEAKAYVLWRAYDLRCQSETETEGGEIKAVAPEDEGRVEYTTSTTAAPDYCALATRYRTAAIALIDPPASDPFAGWPRVTSVR